MCQSVISAIRGMSEQAAALSVGAPLWTTLRLIRADYQIISHLKYTCVSLHMVQSTCLSTISHSNTDVTLFYVNSRCKTVEWKHNIYVSSSAVDVLHVFIFVF